jgi:uncharacterized protein
LIKTILDTVTEKIRSQTELESFELPIFPLGSVLFPGGTLALKLFEQRYLDMAKDCLKRAKPFGIALIREGYEVGAPAAPHPVGTSALIDDWDMPNLGVLQVKVSGGTRFRIISSTVTKSGLIMGTVNSIDADLPADLSTAGVELTACADFLKKILTQINMIEGVAQSQFLDASWVSFRITELLPFGGPVKQKMLELTDAKIRLDILHRFLIDQKLIEVASNS